MSQTCAPVKLGWGSKGASSIDRCVFSPIGVETERRRYRSAFSFLQFRMGGAGLPRSPNRSRIKSNQIESFAIASPFSCLGGGVCDAMRGCLSANEKAKRRRQIPPRGGGSAEVCRGVFGSPLTQTCRVSTYILSFFLVYDAVQRNLYPSKSLCGTSRGVQ